VQETYLRAYAGFGSYRGENTRAWLAAICLNVARSEARRRRRRPWEVPARSLLDALPPARAATGTSTSTPPPAA
jgi:DNA-directed RNA polymerase specialized sigma24 family protein